MSELTRLTGIGPKRLKALESSGIRTLRDLIYYLPRRYVDRTRITPIHSLREGMDAFLAVHIEDATAIGTRLMVRVSDDSGDLELVFFRGVPFLKQRLRPGKRISVAGPVSYFRGFQIVHPEWEELREGQEPRGGILPVYPMTEEMEESRVDHKLLQRLALEGLEQFTFSDPLPPEERSYLELRPENTVLKALHAPLSLDAIPSALEEIKMREVWPLCLKRVSAKRDRVGRGRTFPPQPEAEYRVREGLPFTLTQGQEQALAEMNAALAQSAQFAGLLQGDVGSGKTAVVLLAALRVMAAGAQVALLAPTEILAAQHLCSATALLAKAGMDIALLTASAASEERIRILEGLHSGKIPLVIGTHSLLSAEVVFRELRFILIDEQHRFGVEQRATMLAKGVEPHVLFLSATPIPRTLAQSVYGDLDLITLAEKPPGRLPVKTRLVPFEKQPEMLEFLLKEVEAGNQVYWVVPRITPASTPPRPSPSGEGDRLGNNTDDVAAVESTLRRLRAVGPSTPLRDRWRVEAVHGRMSSADREKALTAFRNGECRVLVATTVIEVGVDVPAANIMVVEGADRFGLAQLHQLRGRTGRGTAQAWCFLLDSNEGWPIETEERLREFAVTEDGFRIAEMDLRSRGAGSLVGTQQSGFGALRYADFLEDAELIHQLSVKAEEWLNQKK